MRITAARLTALALGSATLLHAGAAPAQSAPAPIVGQDVMGDKSRSGPDGWAQAPVSRNQAPSGNAPGQTSSAIRAAPDALPSSAEGKSLPPGQDPGTPAIASPSGPGSLDTATSTAKP